MSGDTHCWDVRCGHIALLHDASDDELCMVADCQCAGFRPPPPEVREMPPPPKTWLRNKEDLPPL